MSVTSDQPVSVAASKRSRNYQRSVLARGVRAWGNLWERAHAVLAQGH